MTTKIMYYVNHKRQNYAVLDVFIDGSGYERLMAFDYDRAIRCNIFLMPFSTKIGTKFAT
jgi:hypothetical protein